MWRNVATDVCQFICEAKDEKSAKMIMDKLALYKLKTLSISPNTNLAWCISYPHGKSQRLTIGEVMEVDENDKDVDFDCPKNKKPRKNQNCLRVREKPAPLPPPQSPQRASVRGVP